MRLHLSFSLITRQKILCRLLNIVPSYPPGISRHIIHGRALLVNYPIDALKDTTTTLQEKNDALFAWIQMRLAHRKIRYYAETTYQFDE